MRYANEQPSKLKVITIQTKLCKVSYQLARHCVKLASVGGTKRTHPLGYKAHTVWSQLADDAFYTSHLANLFHLA